MDQDGYRLHDPARLGYRIADTPDGGTEWVPLTLEDFLNPTPRCEACQDGPHSSTLLYLASLLRQRLEDQNIFLGVQMRMIWHIPGLPEPAPDLFIDNGIREVTPDWWYFDVVETGLRPSLIIEIATLLDPEVRRLDYERKVEIYEQAQIPEYLIIAPASRLTDGMTVLTGYRLGEDGRYRESNQTIRAASSQKPTTYSSVSPKLGRGSSSLTPPQENALSTGTKNTKTAWKPKDALLAKSKPARLWKSSWKISGRN